MNLRLVVYSQRLLSSQLAPFAVRVDQRLADRWKVRTSTYSLIQRHLRDIGGRLGKGGPAAAEGANAVIREREIRAETVVEPRVLDGFQLPFERVN